MRHLTSLAVALAIVAGQAAWPAAATNAGADTNLEGLLAAHAAGDYQILHRTITTLDQYERLRKELGYEKDGFFYHALARWRRAPRRIHTVFMLDLALVGFNHGWVYWLDVVEQARKLLTMRLEPPGADPDTDRFEIAWHKASIALLESLRRPDLVEKHGVAPLETRMAATPLATGEPRLIDPWIALARGVNEEQWSVTEPTMLPTHGVAALRHFEEAAAHESTRAEALVRKAWLLVRLGRPADALTALDGLSGATPDAAVRYWSRLFRGRALDALGRTDEAERAYRDALDLVPHAQAPSVALTALELRRGRHDEAYRWAAAVRGAPADLSDPWWQYFYADFRFFRARLVDLRRGAKAGTTGTTGTTGPRNQLTRVNFLFGEQVNSVFDEQSEEVDEECRLVSPVVPVVPVAPVVPAQQPVFRRAVHSVELDVAVMAGNRAVADLTAADFEVLDNGVKQTVREVIYETQPIDLTLVLDTSGSVDGALLASVVRAVNRIRERLRRDDRVSVVTFDQRIRDLVALSSPAGVKSIALDRGVGPTSLNDAIAVALAVPPPVGRRQMALVFTDGVDTISFLDEPAVLDVAGRSRTAVFVVALHRGVSPPRGSTQSGTFTQLISSALPEAFFNRLAETTGGVVQVVSTLVMESNSTTMSIRQNTNILDSSFLKAFEDFRTSYVLRYTLEGVPHAGWHDVTVRVTRPGRPAQVRARRGYIGG
jgi:VWFA-related protein